MEVFTVEQKQQDLRKYLREKLVIGKLYTVSSGYKKEANSSALYAGRYKALEIYPNTVLFQNPVGGMECFTLMDAVNIMQGIPI